MLWMIDCPIFFCDFIWARVFIELNLKFIIQTTIFHPSDKFLNVISNLFWFAVKFGLQR
jgi:hypothetical protein